MNVLGMFAKRPTPGRTKTRLAASIGGEAAVELYAAFVEDLLERLPNVADTCVVAVTPKNADTTKWFEDRVPDCCRIRFQPDGTLGDRIQWFFDTAFDDGASRAVLIGSDSPDIPESLIGQAFERLKTANMVLSPAADGGYVLVGMSCQTSRLFENVSWSTALTLPDTVSAAKAHNLSVELLSPWYDVDTIDNLGTLFAMQQCRGSAAAQCPKTRKRLDVLWPVIEQHYAKDVR